MSNDFDISKLDILSGTTYNNLLDIFSDKKEIFNLIQDFIADLKENSILLEQYFHENNSNLIKEIAHKNIGSCKSIGSERITFFLRYIEKNSDKITFNEIENLNNEIAIFENYFKTNYLNK